MASRRHPFQGQFGLNDTPLTKAITYGEFKVAEEIIEATTDPSFLNDGPYENIPLHMVLTNNHYADHSRNLKLAQLLVQKGANPNLRIPYGDMDGASPSPFEELVVYYEVLKSFVAGVSEALCDELEMYFEVEESKLEFLTNTVDLDDSKCLPNIENCHKLIQQTSDLIDVFLLYGSDPSVLTTFAHKSLFHWVIEHEDVALAKRFLDTCRVNLNLSDVHGSTPLMDTILRNNPENSLTLYEAMCDTVDFVDLNPMNCCGETALFRAMFVGATEVAAKLCKDGATLKSHVYLSRLPMTSCREPQECPVMNCGFVTKQASLQGSLLNTHFLAPLSTPLLAPLLADSPTRQRYAQVSLQEPTINKMISPHKHLVDKIISSSISPLIDQGYFSDQTVAAEIMSLTDFTNFQYLQNGEVHATDLITLMFGQISSGLRQLCVRAIFDYTFMVSDLPHRTWPDAVPDLFCVGGCEGTSTLCKTKELIDLLGLPHSFKIFFDIEAAKYQISNLIKVHETTECDQACSVSEEYMFDDDDESSDSSESSSDYGDSLLFFSSDMLSEESSEEVEDLSDEEDFSGSEEDAEKVIKRTGEREEVPGRRKIKFDQDSFSSQSDNMRVVVESFCEDLAEDVAQQGHPTEYCDKYQRLTDESTTTTSSPENLTASDSISDSLC